MLRMYQEIEAKTIIPALRRELALALKEEGVSQNEIAQLFNMSPPAISQYFSNKRAVGYDFDPQAKQRIREIAHELLSSGNVLEGMQEALTFIETHGGVCFTCRQQNKELSDSCKVCF